MTYSLSVPNGNRRNNETVMGYVSRMHMNDVIRGGEKGRIIDVVTTHDAAGMEAPS